MKPMTLILLLGALALVATSAPAEEEAKAEQAAGSSSARKAATPPPVFVPANRGAPRARIGGATRGEESLDIEAVVPDRVGLTLEASPSLYWYALRDISERVDLTLVDAGSAQPILETTLTGPFAKGLQRVDLAQHGVKLEPGVQYQWFVALVRDPARRSKDSVAGGGIERVAASPELEARLASADDRDAYRILAESGIWYDAVDRLSRRIDTGEVASLREERAALLSQVGLEKVASLERADTQTP
jgi:hypothetical protein